MTRPRRERAQLLTSALLFAPLGLFFFLRERPDLDRVYAIPVEHFYVVSATTLAALVLAILVGIASVRTRQPRTLLVAAGFLAIAGIFSVHGLSTPGAQMLIKERHDTIFVSARLSLFVGGLFFLLSTLGLPVRIERFMARHHWQMLAAAIVCVALYIGGNLAIPSLLDFVPTGQETKSAAPSKSEAPSITPVVTGMPGMAGYGGDGTATATVAPARVPDEHLRRIGNILNYSVAVVTALCFLFAAWRYRQIHAISLLPATGAMALGAVLLAQSQVSMTLGETWHLSWWLYHVLMLFGFLIPITGIGWAYLRGSSLGEIVEGFFLRDTLAQIERSFPEAMERLIAATVAKDPYLRGHCRRVCALTTAIGTEIGLSPSSLRAASYGALLHDIGKIGIPDAILQKPGRLSDEEFAVLKEHPMRGWHIVTRAPSLQEAAPAIRWHHERLDGTGYPDRLQGEAIPLEARIVAVADVWDALTSDRVYRKAWELDSARTLLIDESGTKLDARCVTALLAVLDRDRSLRFPTTRRADDERRQVALLAG